MIKTSLKSLKSDIKVILALNLQNIIKLEGLPANFKP
jgi:hypothetical protein